MHIKALLQLGACQARQAWDLPSSAACMQRLWLEQGAPQDAMPGLVCILLR